MVLYAPTHRSHTNPPPFLPLPLPLSTVLQASTTCKLWPHTLSVMYSRHKHNRNNFNREERNRKYLSSVTEVDLTRGWAFLFFALKSYRYIFLVGAQRFVFRPTSAYLYMVSYSLRSINDWSLHLSWYFISHTQLKTNGTYLIKSYFYIKVIMQSFVETFLYLMVT